MATACGPTGGCERVPISVGYDARAALQGAGVGRYARALLQALLVAPGDEEYVVLAERGKSPSWLRGREHVRLASLPVSQRASDIAWQRLRIPVPVEWFTGPLRIYHSPDYLLPPLAHAAGIVTVHDLSFARVPQFAHPQLAAFLNRALPRSLRRAALVLADSACTAEDLVACFGVPAERVRTIYLGVEARFCPQPGEDEREHLAREYGLDGPYLLTVGTIEPRKNLVATVEGFKRARLQCTFDGVLAIAGAPGWLAEESLEAARRAGRHVRLLGRVPDADLPALYRQAEALVYASHYEGFGLPPLEAMACGTPVIVSNNSSLPEVVGGAGLYCETDAESIAGAIVRLLEDAQLRTKLVRTGLERARLFTWERTAEQVRQVYHEVV